MNEVVHSWSTVILSVLIAMLVALFGMALFKENYQQQSAQAAVESALMAARDPQAAEVRGVFVIDTKTFKENLENAHVPRWEDRKGKRNVVLKLSYLPDQSDAARALKTTQGDHKGLSDHQLAIRAVKVQALTEVAKGDTKNRDWTSKDGTSYKIVDTVNYVVSRNVSTKPHDVTNHGVDVDQNPGNTPAELWQ